MRNVFPSLALKPMKRTFSESVPAFAVKDAPSDVTEMLPEAEISVPFLKTEVRVQSTSPLTVFASILSLSPLEKISPLVDFISAFSKRLFFSSTSPLVKKSPASMHSEDDMEISRNRVTLHEFALHITAIARY